MRARVHGIMTPKRQSPKPARRLVLVVRTISPKSTRGCLQLGALSWPCAIGRSGRGARKREGDGLTPVGRWQLRQVLYRADRGLPPRVALPLRIIRQNDGWCDESTDRNYNRSVRQPYPASAEKLSRDDRLYDVVVVLRYNERPWQRHLHASGTRRRSRDALQADGRLHRALSPRPPPRARTIAARRPRAGTGLSAMWRNEQCDATNNLSTTANAGTQP